MKLTSTFLAMPGYQGQSCLNPLSHCYILLVKKLTKYIKIEINSRHFKFICVPWCGNEILKKIKVHLSWHYSRAKDHVLISSTILRTYVQIIWNSTFTSSTYVGPTLAQFIVFFCALCFIQCAIKTAQFYWCKSYL